MVTRRRFVTYSAATLVAGSFGAPLIASEKRRRLEDIVPGRTFDFEIHLNDRELYTGTPVPDIAPVPAQRLDGDMKRWGWDASEAGYAANRERLHRYLERTSIDLKTQHLLEEFDHAGIDTGVHQTVDHSAAPSSIGRHYVAGFDRMMADARRVREQHPGRIITMVGIDPRSGKEDAVRRFEVAIRDYGCKGLGEVVLQQFQIFPHDRSMYPLYEKCVEYNLPFIGNCEGPSRFTMPKEFEAVAKDFPTLKICLAGAGRPRGADESFEPVSDALRLASEYENVFLDTADWQRRDRQGIIHYLDFLRRCFDSAVRSKVMFGSDFPVAVAAYSTSDWIDVVINRAGEFGFTFSDAEIASYFSGNALEFLKEVL